MNLRHLRLISYPDSLSYSMFVDPFKPLLVHGLLCWDRR